VTLPTHKIARDVTLIRALITKERALSLPSSTAKMSFKKICRIRGERCNGSGVRSMGWRRTAPRLTARTLQLFWRKSNVTERRTALRRSVYARARRCALPAGRTDQGVLDNLSTLRPARSIEPFARAKRTTCGTGWSPITPQKHRSWLNMTEIEIDVLRSQGLDGRIAEPQRLVSEIAAWKRQRNSAGARIKWMFTTERTRAKLARIPGSKQ
jgi:hypothetical protein